MFCCSVSFRFVLMTLLSLYLNSIQMFSSTILRSCFLLKGVVWLLSEFLLSPWCITQDNFSLDSNTGHFIKYPLLWNHFTVLLWFFGISITLDNIVQCYLSRRLGHQLMLFSKWKGYCTDSNVISSAHGLIKSSFPLMFSQQVMPCCWGCYLLCMKNSLIQSTDTWQNSWPWCLSWNNQNNTISYGFCT